MNLDINLHHLVKNRLDGISRNHYTLEIPITSLSSDRKEKSFPSSGGLKIVQLHNYKSRINQANLGMGATLVSCRSIWIIQKPAFTKRHPKTKPKLDLNFFYTVFCKMSATGSLR